MMNCQNQPEPEPSPLWKNATRLLAWHELFEIHNYFFASCFGILFLYSLISLFSNVRTSFKKHLCIAISLLLALLGLSRALYLILDPYESADILQRYGNLTLIPLSITRVLHGIAYPCLSSSFTLIFMAILKCVQIKILSPKFRKPILIYTIIILHFLVVFSVDITTVLCSGTTILLILCQSFFIIWGTTIGICYLYCSYRILNYNFSNQVILKSINNVNKRHVQAKLKQNYTDQEEDFMSQKGKRWSSDQHISYITPTIQKVIKVTIISACLGFVSTALNCFSLFGIYGVLQDKNTVDPWLWLIYQSLFRIIELCMGATMAFTVTRTVKTKQLLPQAAKTNVAWQ
ncbi:hypothetical protein TrispH2_004632 [Trichoplax sp. H2]|nr:hypothetical protein TrispH2_004632 [Trichoplax sp. H2]|eukprot:RDD44240.1 hypothetical protein TrispH2_004632 [Trichoplax sp. H2]